MIIPIELRKLRARMVMKDMSVKQVSELSGVPYTTCSQILNGRLNHADYFNAIKRAVRNAPMPAEAAAA